jgi:signal transduction histidine kinase
VRKITLSVLAFVLLVFANAQNNMTYLKKAFAQKDSSDYYFIKAWEASKTEADEAEYFFCKNAFCVEYGKEDSSLYYGKIALEKYAKVGERIKPLYVHNNMAKAYQKKAEYKNAIQVLFQGLKLAEIAGHDKWRGWFYQGISLNYHDFADYAKGAVYGKLAYEILKNDTADTRSAIYALNAVAINFDDWNKPDSALYYHMMSLTYKDKIDSLTLGQIYNNIGNTLLKQKRYAEALPYIKSAVAIAEINLTMLQNSANYYDAATTYTNLSRIHYELKEYDKAAKVFGETGKFVDKSNSAEKRRDYYQLGFWINKAQRRYREALLYSEQYNGIRDSVFSKENARVIAEIETQYQVAEKEKNFLALKVKSTQKNLWILGLSVSIGGLVVIAYLVYRQQQQRFKLRAALKEIETQQQLHEQKTLISRDLHDNIGSQLTFVISAVENIRYADEAKQGPMNSQLKMVSDFTKDTIVELRDMVWAMNSETISLEELKLRLLNFIEKARLVSEGLNISFDIEAGLENWKFSSLKGINIYRSVQEALNNALKYAKASHINIQIAKDEENLQIAIEDNGQGFNTSNEMEGMGLMNMKRRIAEVGGTCTIQSEKGIGTKISFQIQEA